MARALPDGDPLSEATGPGFSWIATGLRPGLCVVAYSDNVLTACVAAKHATMPEA
jgi:hypothetical protein